MTDQEKALADKDAELAKTKKALADKEAELAETKAILKAESGQTQELANLKAELAETRLVLAETKAQLDDSFEVVADLKEQLAETPVGSVPTIKHKQKTYQVLSEAFTFNGALVTLADLKADESLVAALLDCQAGVLAEVATKKK